MPKWFAQPRKEKEKEAFVLGKETDSELVTLINTRYKRWLDESRNARRQWMMNSAFVRGQQFSLLHRTEDRLLTLKAPPGRILVMDNMIGPWRDHMVANMATAIPSFEAIPANQDSDAVSAARLSSQLLTYYWHAWKFSEKYIKLNTYLVDFANAFVFLNYKVNTGQFQADPAIDATTGEPAIGVDGNALIVRKPIDAVTAEVLMPHNVACTLDGSPIDEKPWIIIIQPRSMAYFLEQYENGEQVVAEYMQNNDDYSINRISDITMWVSSPLQDTVANELIFMQPPNAVNPEGVVACVAGNVLLKPKGEGTKARSPWPYQKLMTYPLEHFHFPTESGEFYARSRVENQIPLQRSLNILWSTILENAESMGHIKMLIPAMANVETPSNVSEVIRYTGNQPPSYMTPPPLPEFIAGTAIDRLKSAIRDAQNYHGASMGGAVSGVRSDSHAQNLQEQDMLPLTTLDGLMAASFERLAEKALLISAEKLSEERIIQYAGKDRRMMFVNFKGALLGETRKVSVRLTNTFMRTKNAVQNNIVTYFQQGMITDNYGKPDPVQAMKLLEFALPDSVNKDLQMHSEVAYRENDRLMTNQETWVLPYQNHFIHMNVHQEFQNSGDFMQLYENMKQNPENKRIIQAFDQHVAQHNDFVTKAMGMLQQRPPAPTENRPAEGATKPARA
jgi:hypothetical protein